MHFYPKAKKESNAQKLYNEMLKMTKAALFINN